MSDSTLPKLKTKRTAKSSLATVTTSSKHTKKEVTLSSIKKEVSLLYPHLQSVEKELNTLKQQIPLNLNKIIVQLHGEIEKVAEEKGLKINENDSEKSELQNRIDTLQSKLNMELDVSIANAKTNLEKKIIDLTKPRPKKGDDISLNLLQESTYDSRIDSLEQSFLSEKQKTQKRISAIEESLQKFNAKSTLEEESTEAFNNINTEIDSNRKEIASLRSSLVDLKNRIQIKDEGTTTPLSKEKSSKSAAASQLLARIDIPNVDAPLESLHNNVIIRQNEFNDRVKSLKKRTEACENNIRKVGQTATNIVTTTRTLESRITEVDCACKELANMLKKLALTSSDGKNQNLIHELTEKIIDDNSKLRAEIEAVRLKALQCQKSLITNFDNK